MALYIHSSLRTGATLELCYDHVYMHVYIVRMYTDMRRLTTGIRSEKCVVRRFRRRANVIQSTYTNLDSVD